MMYLFYFLVLTLAFVELLKAMSCEKIYSRTKELRKIRKDKPLREAYLKGHPSLLLLALVELFLCWPVLLSGLLTNQWPLFLFVMLLSFTRFQRLGAWAVFIDSIVTICFLVFAALNAFHFHIPFY